MARQFKIETSVHGMPCIQGNDLSQCEMDIVSNIVRDSYMNSDAYVLRTACGAFLQGYQPPWKVDGEDLVQRHDGWILVEFWSKDQKAIEAFVGYVNQKIEEADRG